MLQMMAVTINAGRKQKKKKKKKGKKKGERREKRDCKITQGRINSFIGSTQGRIVLLDQHRAGINLTTYCLLPTAGVHYMLPTTAYYALPATYYHYSTGAMRYLLRVLLASSASEACVTLIRAELSWST